jgi:hypothetical protein
MDKIENKYNKLFIKLNKIKDKEDREQYHIFQDSIYKKFIIDISNNKFNNVNDITIIAKKIKKNVIKYDKDLWYS